MKILLSGAADYVGGHFLRHLVEDGHEVEALVRSIPPHLTRWIGRVRFRECDLAGGTGLKPGSKADVFIHLGAAGKRDSLDPDAAFRETCLSTRRALDYCVQTGSERFLHFSTAAVYGPLDGFVSEQDPLLPRDDYAATHAFAEEWVRMVARNHGLASAILRPANIYGAPLDVALNCWEGVPACFCVEAVQRGVISLNSSGEQLRDFVSLEEVYNQSMGLIANPHAWRSEAFNLASGSTTSILDVAWLVQRAAERELGLSCDLSVQEGHPMRSNRFQLDTSSLFEASRRRPAALDLEGEIRRCLRMLSDAQEDSARVATASN